MKKLSSLLIPQLLGLALSVLLSGSPGLVQIAAAQDEEKPEKLFSGPQPGESLPEFDLKLLPADGEAKTISFMEATGEAPVLLVFVHEVTRPSVMMIRTLTNYAKSLQEKDTGDREDAMAIGVVFLSADVTDTENWVRRARNALPGDVQLGISPDGIEGPGAYGLNRNVTLTILVGDDKTVSENFALVQPSLQADAYPIVKAIAKAMKKEPPSEEEFLKSTQRRPSRERPAMQQDDATEQEYGRLMRPFIQKGLSEEEVNAAAAEIVAAAEKNPALKNRIGSVCRNLIEKDVIERYGNEYSRAYLKEWAESFK